MTSIFIALLCLFLAIYALLHSVLPQLYDSVSLLVNNIPTYLRKLSTLVVDLLGESNPELAEKITAFLNELSSDFPTWLKETALPGLESFFSENFDIGQIRDIINGTITVGSFLINLILDTVVSIVVTAYALAGRKKFTQQGKLLICAIFSKKWADILIDEIKYINFVFSHYVSGRLLDCTIVGLLIFIACSIVQIPQAALVSILVGASNIIPFFGPYIGTIPSALIILMIDPIKFIYFVILVIIIQQIDSNILDPFVVGNSIDMSSFWILFSVLLFGGLFGFAGLLLGVPTFAIFYDIVRKLTAFSLKKRGKEGIFESYQSTFHDPTEERSFIRERAKSIRLEKKAMEASEKEQSARISILVKEAQASGTTEAEPAVDTATTAEGEPSITIPIPIHAAEHEDEDKSTDDSKENSEEAES
jgi:predicted PurR-regulated permease PerM